MKTLPNVKGTKYIEIGSHQMEVWYQSPYPDEFTDVPKLYICEYCLGYMKTKTRYNRHRDKCVWRYPPGEEVYRYEYDLVKFYIRYVVYFINFLKVIFFFFKSLLF